MGRLVIALALLLAGIVASPDGAGAQAVQHGAQPNPQEVRPAAPDGDSPSAAAGSLRSTQERRILGLPVNAVLLIVGVLVLLLLVAGAVLPRARRGARGRGGGTFGRR
ncbi:MAG: hypothetical protein ACREM3_06815 [Candidatus Rokuibacteriota bacterium]